MPKNPIPTPQSWIALSEDSLVPTRIVRLEDPASLLGQPAVQELVGQSDLSVNILRARITLAEGWIELELGGLPCEIDRAMEWLRAQGLSVETPG